MRSFAIVLWFASAHGAVHAQPGGLPSAEEVDAAIERGVQALLAEIGDEDEIEYRTSEGGATQIVRGRMTRQTKKAVFIATEGGRVLEIQRAFISRWARAGYVRQEMDGYHHGGPTALVGLALISAGVTPSHPKMVRLLDTMSAVKGDSAGTYVRSLRAAVWSAVLDRALPAAQRRSYRKLLGDEVRWLQVAMRQGGGYGYTDQDGPRWDNSNTQFGNLGAWAGDIAGAHVPAGYWRRVSRHWLETQNQDGGWSYARDRKESAASMTVAGCNSLYLVLDRLYAESGGAYRLFEGASPNATAREEMKKLYGAIQQGDNYLSRNAPNIESFDGYELFGLERLGLASGRPVLGKSDWFRRYVGEMARRQWGTNTIADAFALVFLAHGHAPILIQKLEYGENADQWNYYHRDLAGLCRYMSRTFEKFYRWQIVSEHASLADLEAAPVLYISGSEELVLPDATRKRLREYIDGGGTILLHADRANHRFAKSAIGLFEGLMSDRGLRFSKLDPSHPVYRCYFGGSPNGWERHIPLLGMSDGSRICVFLLSADIAGAWHQEKKKFADCFRLLANLRVFAAPPYGMLPRLLPARDKTGPPSRFRGELRVARLVHRGKWDVHPKVWERSAQGVRHRTGINLTVMPAIKAASDLAEFRPDVLHVVVPDGVGPDEQSIALLRAAASQGTLILIEAADGQLDGISAVRKWVDCVDAGQRTLLTADHAIASGNMDGGKPLTSLDTTEAGASLAKGGLPPPAYIRVEGDHLILIGCPFDISGGLDGHFIWNRVGYLPDSCARIIDNILLYRLRQKNLHP